MVVQDTCDKDGQGLLRGSRPEGCPLGGAPNSFLWGYIDGWNAVRDSHTRIWGLNYKMDASD